MHPEPYDVAVIGGGPAGAVAAAALARRGHSVLLIERGGRIKPCGGAIPPRLIRDFDIPDEWLVARATAARVIAPSQRSVDMPIGEGGFVGMVDRGPFDAALRQRAAECGAELRTATFTGLAARGTDGLRTIRLREDGRKTEARARAVIGADGARSAVGRAAAVPGIARERLIFAYHEIVRSPAGADWDGARCDIHYRGDLSPDFYGWVFPHGETTSVGLGTGLKGFPLRPATGELRRAAGLAAAETLRREGAPLPARPLPRWDNGQDVLLAGDAAGLVSPASGEGIYYAMRSGELAADAVAEFLAQGQAKALRAARKHFMREHGGVFRALGIMQHFWYANDRRRERFVTICGDPDVQRITWTAYMKKSMQREPAGVHLRIFCKNVAHLLAAVPA